MNCSILKVAASFTFRPPLTWQQLNYRQLREKLLDKGYERIFLCGVMLEQFDGGIYLWIDDDIELLLDCYLYLEKIILKKAPYRHYSSLGDGLLTIKSESNRRTAKVILEYCPALDITNLATHTVNLITDRYVWWWRSIVCGILNLASNSD
jgi:hypothetical protein